VKVEKASVTHTCHVRFVLLAEGQGHRVLIFSQFVVVLDLLEELMDVLDLPFTRLDGSTPVDERCVRGLLRAPRVARSE